MQLQENKVLRHVCSKVDGSNSASDNVKSVDLLIACEQALCLGKNSEEREGKGGKRACRQTFEAAIPPLVIIPPIICQ